MANHVDEHFEWDMEKSAEIYARHGFDFQTVADMLERESYIDAWIDERNQSEERMVAVGRTNDLFITVVYTTRGARRRIITAWPSHRIEIDDYARRMGYRDEREN